MGFVGRLPIIRQRQSGRSAAPIDDRSTIDGRSDSVRACVFRVPRLFSCDERPVDRIQRILKPGKQVTSHSVEAEPDNGILTVAVHDLVHVLSKQIFMRKSVEAQ